MCVLNFHHLTGHYPLARHTPGRGRGQFSEPRCEQEDAVRVGRVGVALFRGDVLHDMRVCPALLVRYPELLPPWSGCDRCEMYESASSPTRLARSQLRSRTSSAAWAPAVAARRGRRAATRVRVRTSCPSWVESRAAPDRYCWKQYRLPRPNPLPSQ